MEEVDEIVLHTLRQIGSDLGEISSLAEFNTSIAIESVIRCLKLINPSLELPNHVPQNMSARYRLGSTLASICTELGYKGEIGYQTFLYSNESDLRRIFLFLFENLPKESEKALDEPLDKTALIIKETGVCLTKSLNDPWLPNYCKLKIKSGGKFFQKIPLFSKLKFKTRHISYPFNHFQLNNSAKNNYIKNYLQLSPNQVNSRLLLQPSILEFNTHDYIKQYVDELDQDELTSVLNKKTKVKKMVNEYLVNAVQQMKETPTAYLSDFTTEAVQGGSRFTHSLQLQFTPEKKGVGVPAGEPPSERDDLEEDDRLKREAEEMQEKVDELTIKLEDLLSENKSYETLSDSSIQLIKKDQMNLDELKEQLRVKKCTLSLLPQAETNIDKLQDLIDASSQKLVALAKQWEQHRVPLIEQYRELKELSSRRLNETQRKLEEIKSMREKIRKIGGEARQKEDTFKHLMTAYEKLTKDVNRSAYTKRIMEIVANIKKQKAEIDKVLFDTRNVQKEINKLSGKLERTFTVTDELIFKDAKKDEAIRRAYKYLASLHENCSSLILIVEDTGAISREIRELEDQIEQENQKKIADTLERITSDYKQMQRENATLLAQLK
ncbi:coiled-coil domain-containing protein 22 homolog [Parasteatoda tepidariorum]|uniref:coiled-coil domain-containing protein 22 homolog n=1 Tax=Parasteatoda tepidariorum TaxID=114398 RepID=UPI00077FAF5C|nr:coiled-coil domain-containing protein 22 homolog [Parasteatoda tepidariorum]